MAEERKHVSWRELLEKTIDLGLGAALLTKEAATKLVDDVVRRGSLSKEEGQKLVSELLEKGQAQKEKMEGFVRETLEGLLSRMDLARQSTVTELRQRVVEMEEELRRLREEQGRSSTSDRL